MGGKGQAGHLSGEFWKAHREQRLGKVVEGEWLKQMILYYVGDSTSLIKVKGSVNIACIESLKIITYMNISVCKEWSRRRIEVVISE